MDPPKAVANCDNVCLDIMLEPFLSKLAKHHIVLASGSPRRKEILENIHFPFVVISSKFEENLNLNDFSSPTEFVIETAKQKAFEVFERLDKVGVKPSLIIGADTIVTLGKELFGKPKNKEDAFAMLKRLSGKSHDVITGVTLIVPNLKRFSKENIITFNETTKVVMSTMSPDVIKSYVETGEPLDKAGSYAIQGIGGSLVQSISGDYYNVVGFPLHRFCSKISELCVQDIL